MTKSSLMIGGALVAIAMALPAQAGDTGKLNVAEATGDQTAAGVVAPFELSSQLAAYGRASHDPVALVTAASIRASAGGVETERSKVSESGTDDEEGSVKGNGGDSVDSLLAEARAMAGDSEVVAALVDEVKASSSRGAVGGAKYHVDRVRAHGTDSYRISFRGGEEAEIAVMGDGDTDLDLYVYDENGNSICSDTDSTDQTYCSWYPRWTGTFRIRIKNYGGVYNEYSLLSN